MNNTFFFFIFSKKSSNYFLLLLFWFSSTFSSFFLLCFSFFFHLHCGCIFCTHMWVLHKPPKNDSTFHVFSLWMPILHSYVRIAQATKNWLNISCFFIVDAYLGLICEYCTSHLKMTQHFMFMLVLTTCPKNQQAFCELNVSIAILNKKPMHIIESHAGIASWTLETQCTHCDYHANIATTITLDVWLIPIWYCTKVLVFIEILGDALKYCNIPQTHR